MRLQFLGTGGSQPIPLPTCDCGVCREAVERGVPYARHGYQLHLPGIDAVVDAPEVAPENLVRWGVDSLRYCLLTHWHPDHAAGLRVLSMRPTERADSETFREAKRRTAPTLVTTRGVYERVAETVGVLPFLVSQGYVGTLFLDPGEPQTLDEAVRVRALPYRLDDSGANDDGGTDDDSGASHDGEADDDGGASSGSSEGGDSNGRGGDDRDPPAATAFLFEETETGQQLAVVADDARGFETERLPADLDALVFECGHFTHSPDGERIRSAALDTNDLAHEEVLDRVADTGATETFLSHLGHHYRRSHDDYQTLEASYRGDPDAPDGIRFPHDGLTVDI